MKIAAVIAVLAVALAGGAIVGNRVPLTEPPGLVKRLLIYLTRNSAQTSPEHQLAELRSRTYAMPADRLLMHVHEAVAQAGWEMADTDSGRYQVHAVATTALLGFKDDVRVTLTPTSDEATRVDVTSRSRVGRADFGANIGHVMQFDRLLDSTAN